MAGKSTTVSYRDLPKKGQLAILLIARLADPIANTSIQSYLYYQLKFFDPSASEATLSTQAGILIGAKTAAQVCTGLFWGRLSDSSYGGRRSVLITGLLSSAIACVGYGFSTTFATAVGWQIFGGAMNANIAIIRCVVAELNPDKRHRTRALVLLPLFANAGMLLGPLIGGIFARNVLSKSLHSFPYALPNLIAAALYVSAAIGAMIWLEETRVSHQQGRPSLGQLIRSRIHGIVTGSRSHRYTALQNNEDAADSLTGVESAPALQQQETQPQTRHSPLRFWNIWTFNVICTMLAHFIITGHLGTFSSLWAIFLSTPTGKAEDQHLPFRFMGGLALRPLDVGVSMSFLGAIGVVLQAMVYPSLNDRYGTIKIWRYALCIFPIVYLIAPFPSLAASSSHSDKTTVATWISMGFVMLLFMIGRTGVTPATTLLINDCTPHPSVRATIHTTGTVIGNLSRSVFPVAALGIFGYGLRIGVVGLGFWCLTVLGVLACFASLWVKEGTPVDEPHEPRRSV